MAKNDTSITSDRRKDLPSRGKSKKTLILNAIRDQALAGLPEGCSNEEIESQWFKRLVEIAFDMENKDSGLCLKLITERGWSALKPSSECVNFKFDPNSPSHVQASQVMDAVSDGLIPPDLGIVFVGGIKSMIDIEANTDLKDRIEKLEVILNG